MSESRCVKVPAEDSLWWRMLSWQARAVLLHLYRVVDFLGDVDLCGDGPEGLVALLGLPFDIIEPGLFGPRGLVTRGVASINRADNHERLTIERFVEDQSVVASTRERMQKSRALRRGRERVEPHVCTYFIQNTRTGFIKIGKTAHLAQRLATLSTSCDAELEHLGSVYGDREAEIHDLFAKHRERGEWFRPDADLIAFIHEATS